MENLPEITLAYDNMCNLQRMKVAQNELPFPVPYNNLWQNIKKIIDVFHFKNHTNPNCKDLYNPANFKAAHPNFNTQVGEQTFVWASRFKHIVCAMSKTHHLFFLHRMVLRRNHFTSKCHKNGKHPMLPKRSVQ